MVTILITRGSYHLTVYGESAEKISVMTSVLFLTTVHPRFDTRIFIKEAQTLATKLPHKVVLMVADGKGDVAEDVYGISIFDLGRLKNGRFHRIFAGSWRAFFAIQKLKPTIVHFHDPELIPLGIILKTLDYLIIYDVHEDLPGQILSKHYLPWIVRKPLAWTMCGMEWFAALVFDAIVPATPRIADRFPAVKTVTVHNYPITNELSYDSSIPYAERLPVFAYAGVIAEIRGIVDLVNAFEILMETHDVRLELAGMFSPEEFGDKLQLHKSWALVNYHGELSRMEVAKLFSDSRAGLVVHHPVPNEVEALPIKIFEYMSVSLPIIASDFTPLRRIIEDVGCGLLVEPQNPNSIAKAMGWILDNPKEAEEMGRRGRKAVECSYNWDHEAIKIAGLYNKMLAPA